MRQQLAAPKRKRNTRAKRTAIDHAFKAMETDADYRKLAVKIAQEFALSDAEILLLGKRACR